MANPLTKLGVGIRRNFATLGYRNFEDVDGTVQYSCNHENLEFMGTTYHAGDALPFDVGGTHYSATALGHLRLYWNCGFVNPIT